MHHGSALDGRMVGEQLGEDDGDGTSEAVGGVPAV